MEFKRDQAEYHMSFDYLYRINKLFCIGHDAAIDMNSFGWHQALLAVFREISTEMTEQEVNELNVMGRGLQQAVMAQQQMNEKRGNNSIPDDLYWKLHDYELKLRKIMFDAGLLMKHADDPSKALR